MISQCKTPLLNGMIDGATSIRLLEVHVPVNVFGEIARTELIIHPDDDVASLIKCH